jgi:hypothetical protein
VVAENLDPFPADAAQRGHPLPLFIERTFRDYLAYDRALLGPVLNAFVRSVTRWQQRRLRQVYGVRGAKCGAITFVQRFGGALNLNVHFHCLFLEGGYEVPPGAERVRFLPMPAPSDSDVVEVLADTAKRILNQLRRHGFSNDEDSEVTDALFKNNPMLAQLYATSVA